MVDGALRGLSEVESGDGIAGEISSLDNNYDDLFGLCSWDLSLVVEIVARFLVSQDGTKPKIANRSTDTV